jgi:hypothetical protein
MSLSYRPSPDADPAVVPVSEAHSIDFGSVAPYRRIRSFKNQRNFCGHWWMATTKRHVTFESWCERDHLIAVDFDPSIAAVTAQPFGVRFVTGAGAEREHVPDLFLRTVAGGAVVVDVRPDGLVKPEDQEKFDATAALCRGLGWVYRRVGELPLLWMANVRWLAGYRHERSLDAGCASRVRDVLGGSVGQTVRGVASSVGDPILVLPTIFHLLWTQQLTTPDLARAKLSFASVIELAGVR